MEGKDNQEPRDDDRNELIENESPIPDPEEVKSGEDDDPGAD